jgi:hypothetical protein
VTLSVAVVFEMVAECGRSASLLFSTMYITYDNVFNHEKKKKGKKVFYQATFTSCLGSAKVLIQLGI